jgi:hypothetical protein
MVTSRWATARRIYLFGFGPLSGLKDIYNGQPGTQAQTVFNTAFGPVSGTPSTLVGQPQSDFTFNGAIGLTQDYNLDPWSEGNTYLAGAYVRNGSNITARQCLASRRRLRRNVVPTGPTGTGADFVDGTVHWAWDSSLLDGHVEARPSWMSAS